MFFSLEFFRVGLNALTRIVEFASQEDAQRAIRELSEQPLLGRPVFIREVCLENVLDDRVDVLCPGSRK